MRNDTFSLRPILILVCVALPFSAVSATGQETGRVVDSVSGSVTVPTVGGARFDLAAKALDVEVDLPDGTALELNVITLWDSGSRRFWWTFDLAESMPLLDRLADFDQRYSLLFTDEEIIALELASHPTRVWIARSTSVASTQAQVENKIFKRLNNHRHQLASWMWHVLQEVDLSEYLPPSFCYDPWSSLATLDVVAEHIAPRPEGWEIQLRGRDSRRFRVMLDVFFAVSNVEEML